MKNQIKREEQNSPACIIKPTLVALALLLTAVSPARAAAGEKDGRNLVLAPESRPYGETYREWAASLWQRILSLPVDAASQSAPLSDGQSGDVWLLGGPLGGEPASTFEVSVPEGTALFLSVLSTWLDNAGCPFTDFTVHELRAREAAWWNEVSETTCTVDGVTIPGLTNPQHSPYLVHSKVFSYTLPENDNYLSVLFGDTCIAGGTTIGPAVAEGVFLMLKPLAAGQHVIRTTAIVGRRVSPSFVSDITYVIAVGEPPAGD
jgi:hypothetical protein